ncbi:hypothetical protein [Actinobacillus porcinus]|uniref:hypothetical protein n=1 Tax=Actinobacillus porcinus TaxID=51048 RepID=UPI002A9153EA|nr:hypothetical protein [Actinobacillus porcinus]MDY6216693.1 hypothetical protein [Actinobacillus porcinus]
MTTLHTNPQPFDLNRALNGEPVLLRNGAKAFVKFQLNKPDDDVLVGYVTDGNVDNLCRWWLDGVSVLGDGNEHCDIVGMWQEPTITNLRLTLKRNGRVIGEKDFTFENDLTATKFLDFVDFAKTQFESIF